MGFFVVFFFARSHDHHQYVPSGSSFTSGQFIDELNFVVSFRRLRHARRYRDLASKLPSGGGPARFTES